MRTISTFADIHLLEEHRALSPDLLQFLANYLAEALNLFTEALGNQESSLADHGPIFVLEPGDSTRNLFLAGLYPHFRGLAGLTPEIVEVIQVDTHSYWSVVVILNDSYTPTYWVPMGLDEEVDRHLAKYLDHEKSPRKPTRHTLEEQEPDWI